MLERYVKMNLSRIQRSKLSQLRLGVFPIRVEVGRYLREKPKERKCVLCPLDKTEDEVHVVTECSLYKYEREYMYRYIHLSNDFFKNLSNHEKFIVIKKEYPRQLAKFHANLYYKRRSTMYVLQ